MNPQNRLQPSANPMLFQRLRAAMLSSVLLGSLAFSSQALQAQDYDAWTLNREVLNAAANYTGVLTSSHAQVRKYITWNWETSLSEGAQRERTEAVLAQITSRQQVDQDLIPSLDSDVLAGYAVRFRYCDSTLLSYFAGAGFKHGLSPQQIVDAPILRAERADSTFYGEPLGLVVHDGGELMLQSHGGRRQTIPACMGADYGGTLPQGTVAYMTSAAQKFGVARTRKHRETRKLPCENGEVGPGIKQERFESTDYNAQGDQLGEAYFDTDTPEADGHWKTKYTHCRAPATISLRLIEGCPNNPDSSITYEVFWTEAYAAFPETVWLPSDAQGDFTRDAAGNPTVIKHPIPGSSQQRYIIHHRI